MDDFYIDEKGLASYFEAAWLSTFQKMRQVGELESKSKNVPAAFVHSPYFVNVAKFIANACLRYEMDLKEVLEVGPALGRVTYELVLTFSSIKRVVFVEPSTRLAAGLNNLLVQGCETRFPYIHSLRQLNDVWIDSRPIAKACEHVNFTIISSPMMRTLISEKFDLVLCLNVIDNASTPREIVTAAKDATKTMGFIVLGCTYQWSKSYLADVNEAVDDINEFFEEGWTKVDEEEFDYKFRYNERYSQLFSSHVVIYQKRL